MHLSRTPEWHVQYLECVLLKEKRKLEKKFELIRAITDEAANTSPAEVKLEITLHSK